MDVKTITHQYLTSHGFDGLFSERCACTSEHLFVCGQKDTSSCRAGYLQQDLPPGCDFAIGPKAARPTGPERSTIDVPNAPFPELPTYKGNWHAVYWTPLRGSAERITAFIVAIGEDAQSCVRRTISNEALTGMYGGHRAKTIIALLQTMQDDICQRRFKTDTVLSLTAIQN